MRIPPSPSGSATTALASIGTAASRWLTNRDRTTTSAPSSAPLLSELELESEVVPLVRVNEHRARLESRRAVDEHLHQVVVDRHRRGTIDCCASRLRHHHGDRVADEFDLL